MLTNFFSSKQLKDFCKKAKLDCTGTKEDMLRRIKRYLSGYKVAPRYLKDLTPNEKWVKKFEIRYNTLKERSGAKRSYSPSVLDKKYKKKYSYSFGKDSKKKSKRKTKVKSRKPKKVKKISTYTQKWNKENPKAKSLAAKSKKTGVPLPILKKVYNKGLAAWRGGAHRPGASQQSWGIARVNSFLTCGKTFYFPDHLLAKEAMKKSPKAKAYFSRRRCKFSKMGKRTKSR